MRDVNLLSLSRATEERAMNVSDAFLKLREQILAYYNPDSDLERHGGLNLINTTNTIFFYNLPFHIQLALKNVHHKLVTSWINFFGKISEHYEHIFQLKHTL
jgi:hypothetical protein